MQQVRGEKYGVDVVRREVQVAGVHEGEEWSEHLGTYVGYGHLCRVRCQLGLEVATVRGEESAVTGELVHGAARTHVDEYVRTVSEEPQRVHVADTGVASALTQRVTGPATRAATSHPRTHRTTLTPPIAQSALSLALGEPALFTRLQNYLT